MIFDADDPVVAAQRAAEYEHIKLCAARYIWPKRDEYTPDGRTTWRQWFGQKFGEDYDEYVARKRAEKQQQEEDER